MKWLALLLAPVLFGQDAKEIVLQSVQRDLLNFERLKDYTYLEQDQIKTFDRHNQLKKSKGETYEISILGGRAYAKLIQRDGKPLSEKDARKEQSKMDDEVARRQRESESDKAAIEKERREQRKFLDEVPDEFTFKLLGVENVSGKPAWVIDAEPNLSYQPKSKRAKLIAKMRGKIWIDQGEYQWVKVEAEAMDKMSFGLGLLKIYPGATVEFEQTRVNDEVWLPAHAEIHLTGRAALLLPIRDEVDMQFRDYKKFQAESQLLLGKDEIK